MRRQTEITNRAAFAASAPPAARLSLALPALLVCGCVIALPVRWLLAPPPTAMAAATASQVAPSLSPSAPNSEAEAPAPIYPSLRARGAKRHSLDVAARILDDLDAQANQHGGSANVSATELHILRANLEQKRRLHPHQASLRPVLPGPQMDLDP